MDEIFNTITQAVVPENSIPLPMISFKDDSRQLYDKLDADTKRIVDNLKDETLRESAIKLLANDDVSDKIKEGIKKDLDDKELMGLYTGLSKKTKERIKDFSVRDQITLLKSKLKRDSNKKEEVTQKSTPTTRSKPRDSPHPLFEPHTPNDTPPLFEPHSPNEPPPESEEPLPPSLFEPHSPNEPPPDDETDEKVSDNAKPDQGKQPADFAKMVKQFYMSEPYVYSSAENQELEVKFGTKGISRITVTNYDNVIRKLKSLGFNAIDVNGSYNLRINCEYLDRISGKVRLSDIRTDINGLNNIQNYCKNNDVKQIFVKTPSCVHFEKKVRARTKTNEPIYPVNMDDFNFRVTHSTELTVKSDLQNFVMDNWKKSKKIFRYMNRATFKHPEYPFNVDISIVKYATKGADRWGKAGRGEMVRTYNVEDSNVFNNPEEYEIEIEIDNKMIGPGTSFNNDKLVLTALKKVIKFVLCGLQETNYPVSYPEMKGVMQDYMKMIWGDEYNPKKPVLNKNFIGPSSKTIQLENICPVEKESLEPNIRKSFVVTEKADGLRTLMFITNIGKIYLIDMNMNVMFTGAKTNNKDAFNCLLDGELIKVNKKGDYINLYAAFDIYYYKQKDVRALTFMLQDKETQIYNARYQILKLVTNSLNPISVLDTQTEIRSTDALTDKFKQGQRMLSPIKISCKEFYPYSNKQTIFQGCNEILTKVEEGRFEYETDGLILTHAYYGIGSDKIGEAGSKYKQTWDFSYKWKPPHLNTIDFLVTTVKGTNNEDVVKPIFEDGINTDAISQLSEYKTIELRCGFNEFRDGYINPCENIINDELPDKEKDEKYKYALVPMRFYPTDPYDVNTGLAKIMLKQDETGKKQMFTEDGEAFADGTIVEFSYEVDGLESWRWNPLRVRHDKTTEYRQGAQMYGNAYRTANNNWKSIHYPVTENMIRTGRDIPDVLVNKDVYYNTPSGQSLTKAMRNFHNLYVKKKLIKQVSRPGDTFIDFACGQGGDLPKWVESKLSFVFGIDISKDNLENRLNGACARYLNTKKETNNMPGALFVNGDSSLNIKNGSAMRNDKAVQITKSVFGLGSKDPKTIGKGVAKQFGVGDAGFNVSSCQFAIHYFFESPSTLQGFLRNVAECTKLNGHFIGSTYDGREVFNLLQKVKTHESIKIIENDRKIWEIVKEYGADVFEDDSSCIGYKINVFQETINQYLIEYLVNFNYLVRLFELYGFKVIDNEEAKEMGFPSGSGMFSLLFNNMMEEIKRNSNVEKNYGKASEMTSFEKKISFLNRYFIFKKIREVNTENIQLELSEYSDFALNKNKKETKQAIKVATELAENKKSKIKKLENKLVLKPATEAITLQEEPKVKSKRKSSKKLVIVE